MVPDSLSLTKNLLLHCQRQSITNACLDGSLGELAAFLDCQFADFQSDLCIGLELHHDQSRRVDLSVYCNQLASGAAAGDCPQWLLLWRSLVDEHGGASLFPSDYWLEYDCYSSNYQLAGLFQRCCAEPIDAECVARLLADYSLLAGGEIGLDRSVRSTGLAELFACLGLPQWIGLMERDQGLVKMVIALTQDTLDGLKHFLEENFGSLLMTIGLGSSTICEAIKPWLEIASVRISIDYCPGSNEFSCRLCFELMLPSERGLSGSEASVLEQIKSTLHVPAADAESSVALLRRLPFSAVQPSLNMVDKDLCFLSLSHSKICIDCGRASVKDYVLAKRSVLRA